MCLMCSGVESDPEVLADIYWSGTAPVCVGGCKGRHRELKKDRCGNSDCCWFGYKSLCRGTTVCNPYLWILSVLQFCMMILAHNHRIQTPFPVCILAHWNVYSYFKFSIFVSG